MELAVEDTFFWAFPVAKSLQEDARRIAVTLHQSMNAEPLDEPQLNQLRSEFIHTLNAVIDSGFYYYYEQPTANQQSLSPMVQRTVDSIIKTVRGGIHLVVQRLFKKMPFDDLQKMACYLDSMLLPSENKFDYLAYPLSQEIKQDLVELRALIDETEHKDAYAKPLTHLFINILRTSVHYYYHAPTDLVKINRLAKKTADLGIDGVEKGVEKILHRVLKDVSHKDVSSLFKNIHTLILRADTDFNVCSPEFTPSKKVDYHTSGTPA